MSIIKHDYGTLNGGGSVNVTTITYSQGQGYTFSDAIVGHRYVITVVALSADSALTTAGLDVVSESGTKNTATSSSQAASFNTVIAVATSTTISANIKSNNGTYSSISIVDLDQ